MAGALNLSVKIGVDAKAGVDAFATLKRTLAENEAALKAAREEAARLAVQLKAAGGKDAGLASRFEAARSNAAALKQEVAAGRERIEQMRRTLAGAGIETRNLSDSMRRVAQDAAQAQAAARLTQRVHDARKIIGIDRDTTERDIQRVQAALQRLKDSGRLSGDEMARAMLAAKTRMAEIRAESGGLIESLARVKEQVAMAFAPLAGVSLLAASGARDYLDFGRKLSEILTLTGASRQEIDAFGARLRAISQEMGKDANDLAAAAYNIISAGVEQGRALEVVALASMAATAGVANVNDTARLGLAVMNSYGGSVDNLESIFDTLFTTVKNGVTTIPELASSLGPLLPTAKEAGVAFDELTAALAQLTQNFGGQTAQAVTALNSAIVQLAAPAPEAKERLRALGIEYNGLIGTIAQIREKNLDIEAVRRIIPDIEGAKAVMSLAGSFEQLSDKLQDAANSAGAMSRAYGVVKEDDKASVERLSASWDEFKRALGETLAIFTPVLEGLAGLLRGFNELNPHLRTAATFGAAIAVAWRPIKVVADLVMTSLKVLPGAFAGFSASAMTALTTVKGGFSAFYAAVAGWSIGNYLRNEFAVVEKAGIALVSGLLKGWARIEYAWERIKGIFKSGDTAAKAKSALDRQLEDVDDWATRRFAEIDRKHAGKADGVAKRLAAPKPSGANPFAETGVKSAKAGRAARLMPEAFDAELAALKAGLKNAEDLLEASFRARLVKEQDYWQAKGAMMRQALDIEQREIERKIMEQQRILKTPGIDAAQAQAAKNKLAELQVALDALAGRRTVIEVEVKANLERAAAEIAALKDKLRLEIAQATGTETPEMRAAAIRASLADELAKMAGDAEGIDLVNRVIDVRIARDNLQTLETQWRETLERMRAAQDNANVLRDVGLLTQAQAEGRITQAAAEAKTAMETLLPAMQQAMAALFPPEEVARRMENLRAEILKTQPVAENLGTKIAGQVQDAFATMFEQIGSGAKSAKEAFIDFARSVIAAINRIAAQKIAESLFGGMSKGGGGGLGGFFSAIFKGFASGGYVTGPGTSTSDSIPARLSAGEYVVRADAVRRFGVAFLDAINGLRLPPAWSAGRLAFAAGGLVPEAAQSAAPSQSVRIVNVIDPGLAADYLNSAAGEKTILNVLSRNSHAVRELLR